MSLLPKSEIDETLKSELGLLFQSSGKIRENVEASSLTTFSVGGPAKLVLEPADLSQLSETVGLLRESNLDWKILGAGSNVVFPDSGIQSPIVKFGRELSGAFILPQAFELGGLLHFLPTQLRTVDELRNINDEHVNILVFASCSIMNLSRKCSSAGYSGLEFAAGIPASLGGAIAMNAGAHEAEMSSVVKKVFILGADGEIIERSAQDMDFSYRHSSVSADELVLASVLELRKADEDLVNQKRKSCLEYRRNTQPLHMPSAGSVFRNPRMGEEPIFAAKLIEEVGLKGKSIDGVSFSTLHSNWLVKEEASARSSGVVHLIALAQKLISEQFAINLQPEIKVWDS